MKTKKKPSANLKSKNSQAFVRSLFHYHRGFLYWKPRPLSHFGNKQSFARWNNRYVGKKAGSVCYKYRKLAIFQRYVAVHRIIFLYHHGFLPKEIDHINGDTLDNRIENLRAADTFKNKWNSRLHKNNKSGVKGVFQRGKYWEGYICANNTRYYLGTYKNKKDAVRIVTKARKHLHGEFARAN